MISSLQPFQLWEHFSAAFASKTVVLASTIIGAGNFLVADILTDNKALAITLCTLSTMATAYFTSRPRVIAAQAAREATRHVNMETSNAAIIDRLHYEIERKTMEISLIRLSKHNALNALQAAYWHLDEVRDLCGATITLPTLKKISVKEIFGEEDEQLRKMVEETITRRGYETNKHTP